MPRNTLDIKSYVTKLLNDDLKEAELAQQHPVHYGYETQRKVFADPHIPNKHVVVVNSPNAGQPNVIEEATNYIKNLAIAAKSLIDQDDKDDKEIRKIAIDKCTATFIQQIQGQIDSTKATGDLFSSKKSATNKNFLKELEKAKTILRDYTQTVAKISGHKLKELDHAGHQVRSQNRSTLVHRFKAPRAKEGEEQFIMYIPCGRYTQRQQALMGKEPSVDRDHDTTSHNRNNLVLGNSSMARMVAGTRHADGSVTIHHDSFTGPGARMPYSDFKKANDYKKLAIKAVTLINQEEVIQTIAQRQIDRLTNEELMQNIPLEERPDISHLNEAEARGLLIKPYFKHNPVTECYTQVVTAGQRVAAENQREQFEYVRQMMDAFDGSTNHLTIQTSDTTEVEVDVSYQARMSSWGVNWFRQAGRGNPLADNSVNIKQNARFINQMTGDVLKDLDECKAELVKTYEKVTPLYYLINRPNVDVLENDISSLQSGIKEEKAHYRQALFDYFAEYKKGKGHWNQETLDRLKSKTEISEQKIQETEAQIYAKHKQIEAKRKAYYIEHKDQIKTALSDLATEIKQKIEGADEHTRSALQHFYNTSAYLVQAQELYYEQTWHQEKNNFKLQTLMATLATELDYANTKGCKSNNDRGQRLAQKIVGNALWTQMSEDGLYTGEFLSHERTHQAEVHDVEALDRELTTIQALHHTANTGVSGGKFEIDKAGFADNGLYGKIAKLAKIKDMGPENTLTKNLKISAGMGLVVAGAFAVLAIAFPPAAIVIGAAGLGLVAATVLIAVTTFFTSLFMKTAASKAQNKMHDNEIKQMAETNLQEAREALDESIVMDANPCAQLGGHLDISNGVKKAPAPPVADKSPAEVAVAKKAPDADNHPPSHSFH